MTRLNIRGLAALFLTVLTLGLGQVPASAQMLGRVPYLSPNPCKGVTLSLAFARSTGSNCLNGSRYASVTNMPGWTYTGGASGGSYAPKADGSLQLFAQNVPRITDAGYLAEEARTNLLTYSQQFDNGAWTLTDATIVANVTTAPDGTLTADKLVEGTGASTIHLISQNATIVGSTAYAPAFYLKAAERSWALVLGQFGSGNFQGYFVNLTTGAIGNQFSTGASAPLVTSAGNGWWRVSFTATSTASTVGSARVYTANGNGGSSYAGDGTSGIYIWQADLQAGSFATSPIPTTSVAVTRSADVGYISGLTVPSAYSVLASATTSAQTSGFPQIMALDNGAVTDQSLIYFKAGAPQFLYGKINVGGVAQAILQMSASSNLAASSAAMRVVANDFAGASAGGTVATDASGSVPTTTVLRIGLGAGGANWNGPIRRIVIYPRAMSNAELQAITIGPVSFANDNAPDDMRAALWGWAA